MLVSEVHSPNFLSNPEVTQNLFSPNVCAALMNLYEFKFQYMRTVYAGSTMST